MKKSAGKASTKETRVYYQTADVNDRDGNTLYFNNCGKLPGNVAAIKTAWCGLNSFNCALQREEIIHSQQICFNLISDLHYFINGCGGCRGVVIKLNAIIAIC